MISNRESKFIKSLQLKKFRLQERRFLVEGAKNVLELLRSELEVDQVLATKPFVEQFYSEILDKANDHLVVKENDLIKLGTLKSNNAALAIARMPVERAFDVSTGLTLAYDRINDPGNLGTAIRIADWYGLKNIVCSPDSVDCYNPKVIASSMGSFARIRIYYEDLTNLIGGPWHTYATGLVGECIYDIEPKTPSVVMFGSESHGLDTGLQSSADQLVTIPGYGSAESLNIGVSTGIFCDNFTRLMNHPK